MGYSPHKMSQFVELILPLAMRIWKPKNSKYVRDSCQNASSRSLNASISGSIHSSITRKRSMRTLALRMTRSQDLRIQACFSGHSCSTARLVLRFFWRENSAQSPSLNVTVNLNMQAIRKLAAYFGPLESIGSYQLPDSADSQRSPLLSVFESNQGNTGLAKTKTDIAVEPWKLYPAPHDSPRSPRLDSGCWEIKWEHRDDCVSALMVICFLLASYLEASLTFLEQTLRRVPHLMVTWAHQPPPHGVEHRTQYQNGHFQSNASPYPLHVQGRMSFTRSRGEMLHSPVEFSPLADQANLSTSDHVASPIESTATEANDPSTTDNTLKENQPSQEPSSTTRTEWSDTDFPPLTIPVDHRHKGEFGVWSDNRLSKDGPTEWALCYACMPTAFTLVPDFQHQPRLSIIPQSNLVCRSSKLNPKPNIWKYHPRLA